MIAENGSVVELTPRGVGIVDRIAAEQGLKAALAWLKKHYDLNSNPGLGNQGLYYYYQTFGKAMAALGQDTFVDEAGTAHDWRKDLTEALASRQRPDSSEDKYGQESDQ